MNRSLEPHWIDVPETTFLMIDGSGDPNVQGPFQEAVAALYSLSYALKFALKRNGMNYKVGPLEGRWWFADNRRLNPDQPHRELWQWTLMIAQPPEVSPELFEAALETTRRKKSLAALERVRLESFCEGRCAEILHIGPFSTEPASLKRLHEFIQAAGATTDPRVHKHHEIYLSDFNRIAPEKLRTILRQPVHSNKA